MAIAALAKKIRSRREQLLAADNQWLEGADADGSVSLAAAIDRVVARNGYEGRDRATFVRAVRALFAKTPLEILRHCSIRLLKGGRYLSVNVGNHMLFRVPAFSDAGAKQDADAFVVWPASAQLSSWTPDRQAAAVVFEFRLFPAVNLAMSALDILAMTKQDWRRYQSACEDALNGRRTRDWTSNVILAP